MLTIIPCRIPKNVISEILAITVSRTVSKYNFPKDWQLQFSDLLAIIILEMRATNVSTYNFQKCRR